MRSFTCVSVVVYVARKLRPCPSYSRRRDRINLVLWRSLDKGGGGTPLACEVPNAATISFLGKGVFCTVVDASHDNSKTDANAPTRRRNRRGILCRPTGAGRGP